MIKREPITDPAEVVRCFECVHLQHIPMADGTRKQKCSGAMMWVVPTMETFCSWGVRIDDCSRSVSMRVSTAEAVDSIRNLADVASRFAALTGREPIDSGAEVDDEQRA